MVQVDVFWSYGFGATFALMGARAIKQEFDIDPVAADKNQWYHKPYVLNLIFLSCCFVPSGVWLLWGWPDWETMMVFKDHQSIPFWFATLFALSNMTQGILGYWITRRQLKTGNFYRGYLHFWGANLLFWIVLIHGWDGTGILRFFGTSYEEFHAGQAWTDWFNSSPSWGLIALGPLVGPPLFILLTKLWKDDYFLEQSSLGLPVVKEEMVRTQFNANLAYISAVAISCIGLAGVISLLLHLLPLPLSLPAAALLVWITAVREGPWNLNYFWYQKMMNVEESVYKRDLSEATTRVETVPGKLVLQTTEPS